MQAELCFSTADPVVSRRYSWVGRGGKGRGGEGEKRGERRREGREGEREKRGGEGAPVYM